MLRNVFWRGPLNSFGLGRLCKPPRSSGARDILGAVVLRVGGAATASGSSAHYLVGD